MSRPGNGISRHPMGLSMHLPKHGAFGNPVTWLDLRNPLTAPRRDSVT